MRGLVQGTKIMENDETDLCADSILTIMDYAILFSSAIYEVNTDESVTATIEILESIHSINIYCHLSVYKSMMKVLEYTFLKENLADLVDNLIDYTTDVYLKIYDIIDYFDDASMIGGDEAYIAAGYDAGQILYFWLFVSYEG